MAGPVSGPGDQSRSGRHEEISRHNQVQAGGGGGEAEKYRGVAQAGQGHGPRLHHHVGESGVCQDFDAHCQEDAPTSQKHRGERRADAASSVEPRRGADLSRQPFDDGADGLAQPDEDRKHEGVVKVPEVLDGHAQQRPADPQNQANQHGQPEQRGERTAADECCEVVPAVGEKQGRRKTHEQCRPDDERHERDRGREVVGLQRGPITTLRQPRPYGLVRLSSASPRRRFQMRLNGECSTRTLCSTRDGTDSMIGTPSTDDAATLVARSDCVGMTHAAQPPWPGNRPSPRG